MRCLPVIVFVLFWVGFSGRGLCEESDHSLIEQAQAQMELARTSYENENIVGLEEATLRGLELLGETEEAPALRASLWYWAGVAAELRGDYRVSVDRLRQSLAIRRATGAKREVAGVLNSLAAALGPLGEREAELTALIEAEAIFEELGEARGQAAVANSLGNFYSVMEDPAKALPYHERSVALRRTLDNPDYLADGLYNLGVTLQELGREEDAWERHEEALSLLRVTQNEIGLSGVLTNLGAMAGERRDFNASLAYYEEALGYDRNTGYKRGEAILTRNIAATLNEMGRTAEALTWADQAVEVADAIESEERTLSAYKLRSEIREKEGDYRGALADWRVAMEVQSRADKTARDESLLDLQTRYETAEKEREIERLERTAVEHELALTREQSARAGAEQAQLVEQARGRTWLAIAAGAGLVAAVLAGLFRVSRRSAQRLAQQRTEIEQALAGLRTAHGELKRLYAQKSEWLGFAVHDLRSPLFAIDACCAEVAAGLVDSPTESVKEIRGAVNRMREELDAWLEAERREQTNIEVHPVATDLGRLVADVVGLNRPAARAKSLALVGGDSGTEPLVARVDPWRWREVVDNLVSNAIKFSPAGGSVSVEVGRIGDRGWIRVSDQGPGISAADREQLFGAYARLSAQPTGGESSTGLGLHLVKRLVEAHQGEIRVTDGVNGGAIFEVSVALEPSTVAHA